MADYIDSTILCESYLFVEAYELTPDKKARIHHFLASYAQTRAPLFFDNNIKIDVEVQPGSLRAKVTILGSLSAMVTFYGNLRQSVEYLYKDAQFLASGLVTESIFAAGVRRPDVSRIEVRTGLPGALKRVLGRMDALKREMPDMQPDQFSEQLAGIRGEVERILDTIAKDEDRDAVVKGVEEALMEHYPLKPTKPQKKDSRERPAAIVRRSEIDAFIEALRRKRPVQKTVTKRRRIKRRSLIE